MRDEPSYMSFARANVRDGYSTSHAIVTELLRRIDQLEREAERKAERS